MTYLLTASKIYTVSGYVPHWMYLNDVYTNGSTALQRDDTEQRIRCGQYKHINVDLDTWLITQLQRMN